MVTRSSRNGQDPRTHLHVGVCLNEFLRIDPHVHVLVASGFSGDASVKETIQMGAKSFVSKPFRVKELLQNVRKVLDEAETRGDPSSSA